MRIPFILSLDFFHSGLGSVVQNLVFAFPLSSGGKIFLTKFLPQHVSGFCCTKSSFRISIE